MKKLIALILAAAGFSLYSGNAAAQAEYFGRIQAIITIIISSTVPPSTNVTCSIDANVTDTSGTNIETATATASGTTGTVTCSPEIYYEWLLNNPSTDEIDLSYEVSIGSVRFGSHGLGSITGVPASGTLTTVSANTRL